MSSLVGALRQVDEAVHVLKHSWLQQIREMKREMRRLEDTARRCGLHMWCAPQPLADTSPAIMKQAGQLGRSPLSSTPYPCEDAQDSEDSGSEKPCSPLQQSTAVLQSHLAARNSRVAVHLVKQMLAAMWMERVVPWFEHTVLGQFYVNVCRLLDRLEQRVAAIQRWICEGTIRLPRGDQATIPPVEEVIIQQTSHAVLPSRTRWDGLMGFLSRQCHCTLALIKEVGGAEEEKQESTCVKNQRDGTSLLQCEKEVSFSSDARKRGADHDATTTSTCTAVAAAAGGGNGDSSCKGESGEDDGPAPSGMAASPALRLGDVLCWWGTVLPECTSSLEKKMQESFIYFDALRPLMPPQSRETILSLHPSFTCLKEVKKEKENEKEEGGGGVGAVTEEESTALKLAPALVDVHQTSASVSNSNDPEIREKYCDMRHILAHLLRGSGTQSEALPPCSSNVVTPVAAAHTALLIASHLRSLAACCPLHRRCMCPTCYANTCTLLQACLTSIDTNPHTNVTRQGCERENEGPHDRAALFHTSVRAACVRGADVVTRLQRLSFLTRARLAAEGPSEVSLAQARETYSMMHDSTASRHSHDSLLQWARRGDALKEQSALRLFRWEEAVRQHFDSYEREKVVDHLAGATSSWIADLLQQLHVADHRETEGTQREVEQTTRPGLSTLPIRFLHDAPLLRLLHRISEDSEKKKGNNAME